MICHSFETAKGGFLRLPARGFKPRGHLYSHWVHGHVNSPSQKGHGLNHQVVVFLSFMVPLVIEIMLYVVTHDFTIPVTNQNNEMGDVFLLQNHYAFFTGWWWNIFFVSPQTSGKMFGLKIQQGGFLGGFSAFVEPSILGTCILSRCNQLHRRRTRRKFFD